MRWVSLICGEEARELLHHHPNSFLLLSQIAMRAKWKDCRVSGLKRGEAKIGDWKTAGLKSEAAYVHAKRTLSEMGLATFRGTNKGTIASLETSTIFSISPPARNDPNNDQDEDQNDTPTTTEQRPSNDPTTTNKTEKTDITDQNSMADLPDIVALYPRREKTSEALEALAVHIRNGTDREAVIAGTRAIAAVIQRLAGGHLNKFVPSALTFFRDRRWEDDPATWLRNAPTRPNGSPSTGTLDLGGRRPAETIKLSSVSLLRPCPTKSTQPTP